MISSGANSQMSGAQDACRGVGCAKSGLHNLCRRLNKVDAQMPWGALSVARRLPPTESVFRGRGIGSSVCRCHSRKYMHIRTQYVHIRHIHTNTIIYVHIHAYTNLQNSLYMQVYDIHAYTCIYLHIHAYVYPVRVASI